VKRGVRRSPKGEDGLVRLPTSDYPSDSRQCGTSTSSAAGKSAHTAKFKPWKLVWYCAFPDKLKALAFEKYLKSHSGRAFSKKRLC
jgi:hypothetical protein